MFKFAVLFFFLLPPLFAEPIDLIFKNLGPTSSWNQISTTLNNLLTRAENHVGNDYDMSRACKEKNITGNSVFFGNDDINLIEELGNRVAAKLSQVSDLKSGEFEYYKKIAVILTFLYNKIISKPCPNEGGKRFVRGAATGGIIFGTVVFIPNFLYNLLFVGGGLGTTIMGALGVSLSPLGLGAVAGMMYCGVAKYCYDIFQANINKLKVFTNSSFEDHLRELRQIREAYTR